MAASPREGLPTELSFRQMRGIFPCGLTELEKECTRNGHTTDWTLEGSGGSGGSGPEEYVNGNMSPSSVEWAAGRDHECQRACICDGSESLRHGLQKARGSRTLVGYVGPTSAWDAGKQTGDRRKLEVTKLGMGHAKVDIVVGEAFPLHSAFRS